MWATWIIARLGGWKNYNSKRPPAPIVLKKGLDKFTAIYQGVKTLIKCVLTAAKEEQEEDTIIVLKIPL